MKWLFIFLGLAISGPGGLAQDFPPHSSSGFIPNNPGVTNAPAGNTDGVIIETVRPGSIETEPATVPPPDMRTSRTWGQAPLMIPVLTDPNKIATENNWLASIIARRIVDFARLITAPTTGSLPPEVKIDAQVDAAARRVHLVISGFAPAPVVADLRPEFAWDAHGYAPLAGMLLGNWHGTGEADALPDELSILQDLTAAKIASGDVAISKLLQQHPAWAAAHEEAALLLIALALRDNAGDFSDSRRMLGRATAHLALAEALRGKEEPTWAGKIADAGIRTLSGREVDALAQLDALEAAPDCPEPAKSWIAALRLRAKDDWRLATPHPDSSLLLKIAWFQVLSNNLSDLLAIKQFEATNEFTPATDWGHAVLANRVQQSVEGQNRFCKSTLEVELLELAMVLDLEGSPLKKGFTLGAQLADPLVEQLFSAFGGGLRVIGPDMFKDFARQHLIMELYGTYWWYKNSLGLGDEAEAFRKTAWDNFRGMRLAELTGLYEPGADSSNVGKHLLLEEAVVNNKAQWHPWEIAAGGHEGFLVRADQEALESFYHDGLPFGTVYNADLRHYALSAGYSAAKLGTAQPNPAPGSLEDIVAYMKKTPWGQAHPTGNVTMYQMALARDPTIIWHAYPPADDLQAMAPSSFRLFACDRPIGELIEQSRPWWAYNLVAIHRIEAYSFLLDDATYDGLLHQHAALDPDANFLLGTQLREEGRADDAAVVDRKGFDLAHDEVAMSNSVGPLVDYYYDHNRKEEALMVAKRAADVYSEGGLWLYSELLEKMNRLTEAANCAQDIFTRYHNHERLNELFTRHTDFFHDQNDALMQEIFPNGLKKVDFTSFTSPPKTGVHLVGTSDALLEAGLQPNDVIVALDSYLVENDTQYNYVRAMKQGDHMDIILWRDSRYLIAHTSAPHRRFGVKVENYTPSSPHRLFAPMDTPR